MPLNSKVIEVLEIGAIKATTEKRSNLLSSKVTLATQPRLAPSGTRHHSSEY